MENVQRITPEKWIIEFAKWYVKKHSHSFSNNIGNGDADDTMKIVGFICEFAIKHHYDLDLPQNDEGGKGDGGHDMILNGFKVDIKGQRCNFDYNTSWLNNVRDIQLYDGGAEYIMFAHYNQEKNTIWIPGYVLKKNIKDLAAANGQIKKKGESNGKAVFRNTTYCIADTDLTRLGSGQLQSITLSC